MEITRIRISRRNDDKLKALASVTFDDSFEVRGLKVIQGKAGLFVAMPTRMRPDGRPVELVRPISDAVRRALEDAVLAAYRDEPHEGACPLARLLPPRPAMGRGAARTIPPLDDASPPGPDPTLPAWACWTPRRGPAYT